MLWIFAGPVLLFLIAVPALLPYSSFRLALRNSRHRDGSRSTSRTRREVRHAKRFLVSTVLFPFFLLLMVEVGLFSFHRHAVPSTALSEMFGDYFPETSLHAPDLDTWNDAIAETEERAATERRERGEQRSRRRSLRQALFEHWPLHFIFLLGPSTILLWFMYRYYAPSARAYHDGVQRRHDKYRLRTSLR